MACVDVIPTLFVLLLIAVACVEVIPVFAVLSLMAVACVEVIPVFAVFKSNAVTCAEVAPTVAPSVTLPNPTLAFVIVTFAVKAWPLTVRLVSTLPPND